MKDEFPGYFKPPEKKIEEIWQNALFTFDANVLLNLYRYSDQTQSVVLKVLKLVNDRSWFSNQSIFEYLENRLQVISEQEKSYNIISEELKKIESKFDHPRQHPFLSQILLNRLKNAHEEVSKELEKNKKKHIERLSNDEIQVKLIKLTKDKVGPEFDAKEIKSICEEGKIRYSKKIPPGYKDFNKDDSKDQRMYGDYIIWSQIIQHARNEKKDIILVTDDQKEDWWHIFKGKTIGARPELVKEFESKTNQSILFYRPDKFLELVGLYLESKIGEEVIDEVRQLTSQKRADILLKSYNDYRYLDTNEILYLKSDNNSTDFFMRDGNIVSAFKTLKSFERWLPENFVRVHNNYILNADFLSRINYGKKYLGLKSSSGTQLELPFSDDYKENVERVKNIKKGN